MPKLSIRRPRPLAAFMRRFRRSESGATAVEFALIAFPFFAFMFAIIEVAMVFFASQLLETATQDSARLVLTGQAQTGNYTQADFKNVVCAKIYALFDCQNKIYVDVKSYPNFASINITPLFDTSCNPTGVTYSPGAAGDIVVVRVAYVWPLFVTGFGFNLSSSAGCSKKMPMTATVAFRNEPY